MSVIRRIYSGLPRRLREQLKKYRLLIVIARLLSGKNQAPDHGRFERSGDREAFRQAKEQAALRNWNKSIHILKALPKTKSVHLALAKDYIASRNFEEMIKVYFEALSEGTLTATLRRLYLEALANLGKMEDIRDVIYSELSTLSTNINTLIDIYVFSKTYAPEAQDKIISKMLGTCNIAELPFFSLVMIAHDEARRGKWERAYRIAKNLSTNNSYGKKERATLLLLQSQFALLHEKYDLQIESLCSALSCYNLYEVGLYNKAKGLSPSNITVTDAVNKYEHGPLVSVLMTAFNSQDTISYAVNSILEQTYRNIELIVIDDGSADKTIEILRKLAERDHRIEIQMTPRNSGTYFAKNLGLKIARGKYVTCHDSDDWAHPQKIERLVNELESNSQLVAVQAQHVRCSAKIGLQNRRGKYIRVDASSLMYRREKVLSEIGFYDAVRAGGDGEYQFRMERAFGRSSIKAIPDLLNIVALSERSLSGGGKFTIDENTGAFTELRNAYRRDFCQWHQSTNSFKLECNSPIRKFEVPRELLP